MGRQLPGCKLTDLAVCYNPLGTPRVQLCKLVISQPWTTKLVSLAELADAVTDCCSNLSAGPYCAAKLHQDLALIPTSQVAQAQQYWQERGLRQLGCCRCVWRQSPDRPLALALLLGARCRDRLRGHHRPPVPRRAEP